MQNESSTIVIRDGDLTFRLKLVENWVVDVDPPMLSTCEIRGYVEPCRWKAGEQFFNELVGGSFIVADERTGEIASNGPLTGVWKQVEGFFASIADTPVIVGEK